MTKYWTKNETHFNDRGGRDIYVQRMSYDLSDEVYHYLKTLYWSNNLDDNDRAGWSVNFVNHMIDNHVLGVFSSIGIHKVVSGFVFNNRFISEHIDDEDKIFAMVFLDHSYRENIQTYLTIKWSV